MRDITTATTESRTYFAYAKDVINHYVIDRRRLDLCVKKKADRSVQHGRFQKDAFRRSVF